MRANHRFVGQTRRQSVELSNLLLARSDDLVDAGNAVVEEVCDSPLLRDGDAGHLDPFDVRTRDKRLSC